LQRRTIFPRSECTTECTMTLLIEEPISRAVLLIKTSNEVIGRARRTMAKSERLISRSPIWPRVGVPGPQQPRPPISRGPLHLE
jgi:hypothetical protein